MLASNADYYKSTYLYTQLATSITYVLIYKLIHFYICLWWWICYFIPKTTDLIVYLYAEICTTGATGLFMLHFYSLYCSVPYISADCTIVCVIFRHYLLVFNFVISICDLPRRNYVFAKGRGILPIEDVFQHRLRRAGLVIIFYTNFLHVFFLN